MSISTMIADLPSGDGKDRCAIPSILAGIYRARSSERLSVAVKIPMWIPSPVKAEYITRYGLALAVQLSTWALANKRAGSPPSTGTVHVSPQSVYAIREPSGEKLTG